ncbi:MAG: hypothetical protein OEN22_03180 [Gammaproteobacteria bacterium]|nr:hypothetical protein [Gammaproteobacteria bacterium]
MPIEYSIDKDLGVVFTTASGVLREYELLEHKRKLTSDPNFKPGFVELSDVRHISDLSITAGGLHRFVAQDDADADILKDYKLAIVVSGALEFATGSVYEMMSLERGTNVRIFRDLDQAKEWLDIRK